MTIKDLSLFEPFYAVIFILAFIGFFSTVFIYWLRNLDKIENKSDFKLLIVVAEILGSIGLIGLITFAGRLELNADKFITEKIYARSVVALNKNTKDVLASQMCISAVASIDLQETSFNGLCTFLKKYEHEKTIERYWGYAKFTSHVLTNQLITSGDSVNGLKFFALADSITDFLNAQNDKTKNEVTLFYLNKQNSSIFIIICAILVGLGVSIKIARAFIDWEKEKLKIKLPQVEKPSNTQSPVAAAHE